MALARVSGSEDLKMPEPTNTASAPSLQTSAASAGVAMPPAEKFGTGSLPCGVDVLHQFERRLQLLRLGHQLFAAEHGELLHLFDDGAHVAHGFHDVAGARLALGADHGRALGDAPQRLAQVAAPHTNGTLKSRLSMWCSSSAGVSTSLSSM